MSVALRPTSTAADIDVHHLTDGGIIRHYVICLTLSVCATDSVSLTQYHRGPVTE